MEYYRLLYAVVTWDVDRDVSIATASLHYRNLQLNWLDRDTNDNALYYYWN